MIQRVNTECRVKQPILVHTIVRFTHTWADPERKRSWEARAETRKVQRGEEMSRASRGPDEAAKQLSLEHFLHSHRNQSLEVILLPPLQNSWIFHNVAHRQIVFSLYSPSVVYSQTLYMFIYVFLYPLRQSSHRTSPLYEHSAAPPTSLCESWTACCCSSRGGSTQ